MNLHELKRLLMEATPLPHKVNRYDHGGGRVFVDAGEDRNLIADFYEEADRELFIALRNAAPELIAACEERDRYKKRLEGKT